MSIRFRNIVLNCVCVFWLVSILRYPRLPLSPFLLQLFQKTGIIDLKLLLKRRLGNCQKRREIFNWLRAKGFSIYFLQETHSSEKSVSIWLAEWGYKALFNSCNSASAGVAILFNNNFSFLVWEMRIKGPHSLSIIVQI